MGRGCGRGVSAGSDVGGRGGKAVQGLGVGGREEVGIRGRGSRWMGVRTSQGRRAHLGTEKGC